jgi:hypothetical protein
MISEIQLRWNISHFKQSHVHNTCRGAQLIHCTINANTRHNLSFWPDCLSYCLPYSARFQQICYFLRCTNRGDLKTWKFLRTLSPPRVWSECLLKLLATFYITKAMGSSLHVCRPTSPSYIENNGQSTWHKNEEMSLWLPEESNKRPKFWQILINSRPQLYRVFLKTYVKLTLDR